MINSKQLIGATFFFAVLMLTQSLIAQPNISQDVDRLLAKKSVPEATKYVDVIIQEINEPSIVQITEIDMDSEQDVPIEGTKLQEHRVVKGESLFLIGQHYGISVDALKSLNQLTSNEIRIGQILLVIL